MSIYRFKLGRISGRKRIRINYQTQRNIKNLSAEQNYSLKKRAAQTPKGFFIRHG